MDSDGALFGWTTASSLITAFGLSLLKDSREVLFPQTDWHCCTSGLYLRFKMIIIPLFTFFSHLLQSSTISFSVDLDHFLKIQVYLSLSSLPLFFKSCGLAVSVSFLLQYTRTQCCMATYLCEGEMAVNRSVFDLAW